MSLIGISTGGFWSTTLRKQSGDINSDSNTDINDIILIVEQIINANTSVNRCDADLNFDNHLDLLDIIRLVNKITT